MPAVANSLKDVVQPIAVERSSFAERCLYFLDRCVYVDVGRRRGFGTKTWLDDPCSALWKRFKSFALFSWRAFATSLWQTGIKWQNPRPP
jgi:hypothetical protein